MCLIASLALKGRHPISSLVYKGDWPRRDHGSIDRFRLPGSLAYGQFLSTDREGCRMQRGIVIDRERQPVEVCIRNNITHTQFL